MEEVVTKGRPGISRMGARQMELGHQLRLLTDRLGSSLLDDADNFRAALDDFLPEGAATRGQVHLLVDAIRFGAYARLIEKLGSGAAQSEATRDAGIWLAEERGTSDLAGSTWACEVLGFAAGRLDDAPSIPAPAALEVSGSSVSPRTEPAPAMRESGLRKSTGPTTISSRLEDAPASAQFRAASPTPETGEDVPLIRHSRRVALLAASVAVAAVVATFLPFWTIGDETVNGWYGAELAYILPESAGKYGVIVITLGVLLFTTALVQFFGTPSLVVSALSMCGATGIATMGILLGLVTDGFYSYKFSVLEAKDVHAGWGIWIMWSAAAAAAILVWIIGHVIAASWSARGSSSSRLLRSLFFLTAALALLSPLLPWFEGDGTNTGWGGGGTLGHSARYGVVLLVAAIVLVIAASTLSRRDSMVGIVATATVVASTMCIVVAIFCTVPLFFGAWIEDPSILDYAGMASFRILGALCLIQVWLLLKGWRHEFAVQPRPRATPSSD